MLYRIPGISRFFIYLNDDFLLLKNSKPKDFYTHNEELVIRHSRLQGRCECDKGNSSLINGIPVQSH